MPRVLLAAALLTALAAPGQADPPPRELTITFVDTEGGAATLIVTPAGESILIDCGNPGRRDAERIHDAMKRLGLAALDHLIVTHWHLDHYGGAGRLSELVAVRRFYHHGIPDSLPEDKNNFPLLIAAFRKAAAGKEQVLKPGDAVPLKQAPGTLEVSLRCLCGNGRVVPDRDGAPANPIARDHQPRDVPPTDNDNSLGFLLTYGSFRFLDLGDLTWNFEHKLIHPTDKVGPVDVYQVTHHGLDVSNNPVLMRTVNPRVAVFNNGPRKGASPRVMGELRRLPEVQAVYQLHRNLTVSAAENTDAPLIANDGPGQSGAPIRIAVAADAKSYAVVVGWAGNPRRFQTRQ
jgi:competence protein ComEC